MAKGNKARRRTRRTSKRMGRRTRSRGMSIPSLPPLQPFNRQLVNTVLRVSIVKSMNPDSLVVHDYSTSVLFSSYPQLVACFREVKIQKVRVWVVPASSTSSAGLYTICVAPKDQINVKEDFNGLSQDPGCITRKVFQTSHAVYYPTEPSEKNWFPTTSAQHLFSVQLICTGMDKSNSIAEPGMTYQVICDSHVRFRGRSTSRTVDTFEVVDALNSMST